MKMKLFLKIMFIVTMVAVIGMSAIILIKADGGEGVLRLNGEHAEETIVFEATDMLPTETRVYEGTVSSTVGGKLTIGVVSGEHNTLADYLTVKIELGDTVVADCAYNDLAAALEGHVSEITKKTDYQLKVTYTFVDSGNEAMDTELDFTLILALGSKAQIPAQ